MHRLSIPMRGAARFGRLHFISGLFPAFCMSMANIDHILQLIPDSSDVSLGINVRLKSVRRGEEELFRVAGSTGREEFGHDNLEQVA